MKRILLMILLILPIIFSHCWTETRNCRTVKHCYDRYVGTECHYEEKCVGGYVKKCVDYGCIEYEYYDCDCKTETYECNCEWKYGCIVGHYEYDCDCDFGWGWECTLPFTVKRCGYKFVCDVYGWYRDCDVCTKTVCDTCKKCKREGCRKYDYVWDDCAEKVTERVCEDKYERVCEDKVVCDEVTVCDEKPKIYLDVSEIKPNTCFEIKIEDVEKPYRIDLRVYLNNLELFSGVINSREKEICVEDIPFMGTGKLKVKAIDLSDDPSYDIGYLEKEVLVYADPIIYDVEICYDNVCGIFFDIPKRKYRIRFRTKYADKTYVIFNGEKIEVKNNEVELIGSGEIKIVAENEYSKTEYNLGYISVVEPGRSLFIPKEGRKERDFAVSVLTLTALAAGVYLSKVNDYIRSILIKFVKVQGDFWKYNLIRIKNGFLELTSVGIRYVRKLLSKFSLREIYEKVKDIRVVELFAKFRTKPFLREFEFKYKDLYAIYGKEFVDRLVEKYGERAEKVLRYGIRDNKFIEFVLKNNLENKDLHKLYKYYCKFGKDLRYFKIFALTGREDFVRELMKYNIYDLSAVEINYLLSAYEYLGKEGFEKALKRLGIDKLKEGIIDIKKEFYTIERREIVKVERKLYEGAEGDYYLVYEPTKRYYIVEKSKERALKFAEDIPIYALDFNVVTYPYLKKTLVKDEVERYERLQEIISYETWKGLFVVILGPAEYTVKIALEDINNYYKILEYKEKSYRWLLETRKKWWKRLGPLGFFGFVAECLCRSLIGQAAISIAAGAVMKLIDASVKAYPIISAIWNVIKGSIAGMYTVERAQEIMSSENKIGELLLELERWLAFSYGYRYEPPEGILNKISSAAEKIEFWIREKFVKVSKTDFEFIISQVRLGSKGKYFVKKLLQKGFSREEVVEIIDWLGRNNVDEKLARFYKIIEENPEIRAYIFDIMKDIDEMNKEWWKRIFHELGRDDISKIIKYGEGKEYILELLVKSWKEKTGKDFKLFVKLFEASKSRNYESIKEIVRHYIEGTSLSKGEKFEIEFAEKLIKEGKEILAWRKEGIGDFVVRDGDKIIVYECKDKTTLDKKSLKEILEHITNTMKAYPNAEYYVVFRETPSQETIKLLENAGIKYIVVGE